MPVDRKINSYPTASTTHNQDCSISCRKKLKVNVYISETRFIMIDRFNSQIVDHQINERNITLWELLLLLPPYQKSRQAYHAERENQYYLEISFGLPYQPHLHFPVYTQTEKKRKLLSVSMRHSICQFSEKYVFK